MWLAFLILLGGPEELFIVLPTKTAATILFHYSQHQLKSQEETDGMLKPGDGGQFNKSPLQRQSGMQGTQQDNRTRGWHGHATTWPEGESHLVASVILGGGMQPTSAGPAGRRLGHEKSHLSFSSPGPSGTSHLLNPVGKQRKRGLQSTLGPRAGQRGMESGCVGAKIMHPTCLSYYNLQHTQFGVRRKCYPKPGQVTMSLLLETASYELFSSPLPWTHQLGLTGTI